jgi:SAM-dependent methyltransferase
MSHISRRLGQFTYFDLQLGGPEWRGKKVLDFGGNVGNILRDPCSAIDQNLYWCLDVSPDAIKKGEEIYPEAHWVFYDRYSFAFNPGGTPDLEIPDLGQSFDFIVAFSVFTHMSPREMIELVARLESLLADGGTLAFTFLNPHYNPAARQDDARPAAFDGVSLRWRLEQCRRVNPDVNVELLLEKASGSRWCILINEEDLYVEDENARHYEPAEKRSYLSFYTPEYILDLFPRAQVLPPPRADYLPPHIPEMHHCCVIKKPVQSPSGGEGAGRNGGQHK